MREGDETYQLLRIVEEKKLVGAARFATTTCN